MKQSQWLRERFLLLAPACLLLGIVVCLPVVRVVFLSFTQSDAAAPLSAQWAALGQFARLWQDGRWWMALRNTAVFTAASVTAEMVLGLGIALVLHGTFRGRGAVRALVMLPWALPTAVMALAWAWIFNDSFGVANDILQRFGLLAEPIAWLGQAGTAMFAMILADVWKTTPFVTLILLAGLQSIPSQVLEAARVDGLDSRARFLRITLPLLIPSILVALAFRTVQAYGAFDIAYVMTGGGPGGSTETVSLYAFQNYFRYLDFGYGSALAVQGALLLGALAWLILRVARRGEEEA